MNKIEALKSRIEKERVKLNQMMSERKIEDTYRQSVLLDSLIAEYISLTSK